MRWKLVVASLALAFMTLSASAQVVRCQDAAGKITYSDQPCNTGQNSQLIEPQKSPEQISDERQQANEANERKYRARADEQRTQALELEQRQVQQTQAKNQPAPAAQPNPSASLECSKSKKEMEFVSSIRTMNDDEKRMRMNAVITDMNANCGTKTELLQEPVKIVVPASRSRHITHCAPGFCYDNRGGVYHQNGPNNLAGPNGRTCYRAGQLWNCN